MANQQVFKEQADKDVGDSEKPMNATNQQLRPRGQVGRGWQRQVGVEADSHPSAGSVPCPVFHAPLATVLPNSASVCKSDTL